MSVIENAIKRLQASRGGTAAAAHTSSSPAVTSAPRHREQEANAPPPARTIAINYDALRAAGMLPPAHQERELAQQYRQIKRPVINLALGRGVARIPNGNLIMLASAVPGEGKTFMSLNLAFSVQLEADMTVLLVDGDVVNPRVSQIFGAQDELGLLDVIRDPSLALKTVILPTDLPGFSFLPAGRQDANATELLASARTQEVISQLGNDDPSRLVLFDSAPLLLTTESHALAQLVGQIMIVVKAGQTPHHAVLDAVQTLGDDKAISLVLNQSMEQPRGGYYYQYQAGTTTSTSN
jgi:exopolysaccharide/PEP-CTERM locus tyrosine autokinase